MLLIVRKIITLILHRLYILLLHFYFCKYMIFFLTQNFYLVNFSHV